jgi:hypothetical protein
MTKTRRKKGITELKHLEQNETSQTMTKRKNNHLGNTKDNGHQQQKQLFVN